MKILNLKYLTGHSYLSSFKILKIQNGVSVNEKIVGILGGMGPEATIDFMQRVIKLTPAKDDSDHIRMLIDNNPKVPSRIKAIIEKTGADPAPHLINMAKRLEIQGVDFLVIPCNTAHFYYDKIVTSVSVPVLNMVELTVNKILKQQPDVKAVGLLASTAVLMIDLYKKTLKAKSVAILYPENNLQNHVLNSIKRIKAGSYGSRELEIIQNAADYLVNIGAQAIIVGCTELSVISDKIFFKRPMYDSSQVLAEEVVKIVKETS